MTTAQTIYIVAFSVYLLFFVLFARFFVWKRYSETKYWNKRPCLTVEHLTELAGGLQKKMPFISILVPARNESLVIENTINHLKSLRYPKEFYELVIVTDEKETMTAVEERKQIMGNAELILQGTSTEQKQNSETCSRTRTVILHTLSEFALKEYLNKGFKKNYSIGVPELLAMSYKDRLMIVGKICMAIVQWRGTPPKGKLRLIIKKNCPWLSDLDVDRLYPASLAVAMPVLSAYAELYDKASIPILKKAIRHTAEANHQVTREIIMRMTELVAKRILISIKKAAKTEELQKRVHNALLEMYPTTQEVVERVKSETSTENGPTLKHVIVPYDFDGKHLGTRTGYPVTSTKGRALNWALTFLDTQTEMCGFFDAESRPHKDVLLYIGYKRLIQPQKARLLQGPVFQVRNFYQMTPFCRIAALYQAIAHDWYLPWLFKTLPFVGGTNVFVSKDLMDDIGGWDCQVLTEDLELGVRAYLKSGAWPEYLPYASSEQTPPNFKAFFRQRLRWGTGHLQVVDKVANDKEYEPVRKNRLRYSLIKKGQLEWILYQFATFVPPTVLILYTKNMLDPQVIPQAGRMMVGMFSLVYMGFTIYAYRRYSPYLDQSTKPETLPERLLIYACLFLLPLAAFMFPVPYTSALILKAIGKEPKVWIKTPRTEETRVAS